MEDVGFIILIIGMIILCIFAASISNKAYKAKIAEEELASSNGKEKWIHDHDFIESSFFKYGWNLNVSVDSINRKLLFYEYYKCKGTVIDFDAIIGMDVLEHDGGNDGVERAILGDILFGGVGAVVGATTSVKKIKEIKIIVLCNDVNRPKYEFVLNKHNIETSSKKFMEIKEFISTLDATIKSIIKNQNDQISEHRLTNKSVNNIADELAGYKKLLDDGLIIQEDYDKKKKELLRI